MGRHILIKLQQVIVSLKWLILTPHLHIVELCHTTQELIIGEVATVTHYPHMFDQFLRESGHRLARKLLAHLDSRWRAAPKQL